MPPPPNPPPHRPPARHPSQDRLVTGRASRPDGTRAAACERLRDPPYPGHAPEPQSVTHTTRAAELPLPSDPISPPAPIPPLSPPHPPPAPPRPAPPRPARHPPALRWQAADAAPRARENRGGAQRLGSTATFSWQIIAARAPGAVVAGCSFCLARDYRMRSLRNMTCAHQKRRIIQGFRRPSKLEHST